ncbi:MAG: HlyD family type I secretion periplasmic adaptor subunit [Alphaproteobacteria bacterium]|nr:HlyD family type I secretion periplasmic adaptor subunit [Alphaproteobacteria bacterium]
MTEILPPAPPPPAADPVAKAKAKAAKIKRSFTRDEAAFLPAHLEVLESPPSPFGRAILWLVVLAAAAALLWASLAQLDIVAVSEGRIVPRARLQAVEAPEPGIVREIAVREGDVVTAGQILLALDPTVADTDAVSSRTEYATALLARARAEALLRHADGRAAPFQAPQGADPAAAAAEEAAVAARASALDEQLAGIDQRIAGAEAAGQAARQQQLAIEEALPLAEEQLRARQELVARGLAPRLQVLREEERVVGLRREAQARQAEAEQATAEAAMLRRERSQAIQEFRAQAAAERAEAEAIVATRAEAVRRAEFRFGYQQLVAPVDGIVNEIAVTTLGEVVEAGAPLITIVPTAPACVDAPEAENCGESELIVEAMVLNRDVGFVRPGQRVTIKLEAYPFTRHGALEGVVEHVSPDAIADEQRGLVFPARVVLTRSRLRDVSPLTRNGARLSVNSGGQGTALMGPQVAERASDREALATAPLSPGMAAQVEVITGRRSVLSYLLSPIARATSEAGRER